MPSVPVTITALPEAPSSLDIANFDSRADALLSQLPTMVTQINSVASTTYSNAQAAENAAAAASVTGAPSWVSNYTTGGGYQLNTVVFSPVNYKVYRCILAISGGTTDPSADPTHWRFVSFEMPLVYVTGSTMSLQVGVKYTITYGSGASALTLPTTPADGDSLCIIVANDVATNTIDPGIYTINGVAGVCTLDSKYAAVKLQFLNGGWRFSV